jgi:hypothetical protein
MYKKVEEPKEGYEERIREKNHSGRKVQRTLPTRGKGRAEISIIQMYSEDQTKRYILDHIIWS